MQSPKKQKPQIIAWTDGMTVIPFESVHSVDGDERGDGKMFIKILLKKDLIHQLIGDDAKEFVEQYLHYLAFVEALTIDMGESDPTPTPTPSDGRPIYGGQTRDGRAL